jgi:hypothetical protein
MPRPKKDETFTEFRILHTENRQSFITALLVRDEALNTGITVDDASVQDVRNDEYTYSFALEVALEVTV